MIKKFVFIVLIPILNVLLVASTYYFLFAHNAHFATSWNDDSWAGTISLSRKDQLFLLGLPAISLIFSLIFGLKKKNNYWLLPIIILPLLYIIYYYCTGYLQIYIDCNINGRCLN